MLGALKTLNPWAASDPKLGALKTLGLGVTRFLADKIGFSFVTRTLPGAVVELTKSSGLGVSGNGLEDLILRGLGVDWKRSCWKGEKAGSSGPSGWIGDGVGKIGTLSMESRSVNLFPNVAGTLLMISTLLASTLSFLLLLLALILSLVLSRARPSRLRILIGPWRIGFGRGGLWARARDDIVAEVSSVVLLGSYPKNGAASGFDVVSPLGFSGSKRPSGSDNGEGLLLASGSASASASGLAEGCASAAASGTASGRARVEEAKMSATSRVTTRPWWRNGEALALLMVMMVVVVEGVHGDYGIGGGGW